jgi:biopolymer transport protein ExbD
MLSIKSGLAGSLSGDDFGGANAEPEINMAPLVDMVFILLIFFLVTVSFVRESGVTVQRPQAATANAKQGGAMLIGVTAGGSIHVDHRQVDLRSVRGLVDRFLAESPQGAVIILADKKSLTGRVIRVLDQCRLSGAKKVAVAAKRTAS